MYQIQRKVTDRYFSLNYKRLFVIGMLGTLERQLQEVDPLLKTNNLEFAQVKNEQVRDFLAGFYCPPVIDVTLVRGVSGDSSIVTYSLYDDKSLELINDIVNKCGFDVCKPDQSFIHQIGIEFGFEVDAYEKMEAVSNKFKIPLERMWGAPRYINFLMLYCGLSEKEATQLAVTKFDFPPELANILMSGR